MKNIKKIIIGAIFFFIAVRGVYAAITYFASASVKYKVYHKEQFTLFDLATVEDTELLPGESFAVSPAIHNNSTEKAYGFISIDFPALNGDKAYTYNINPGWVEVTHDNSHYVYAYAGNGNMTSIDYNGETEAVMSEVTLSDMTMDNFKAIDDLSVEVTAYIIGSNVTAADVYTAWSTIQGYGAY